MLPCQIKLGTTSTTSVALIKRYLEEVQTELAEIQLLKLKHNLPHKPNPKPNPNPNPNAKQLRGLCPDALNDPRKA